MKNKLVEHRKIWKKKKILREIYQDWYQQIIQDLSSSSKKTIELGSGTGNFKDFKPDVISTDVEPHKWLDLSFDAHKMPFKKGSIGNLVMIDVLHHLADPIRFLNEASRVLEKGGRLIMFEPYPSPISYLIYKRFHPEPFLMSINYFQHPELQIKNPWDSNQSIPYLLFYKYKDQTMKIIGKDFKIMKQEKLSFILYPVSGGFENEALIPNWAIPIFRIFEKLLYPFRDFIAFRCYIILERK